jgi:hypothetical protein
LTRYAYDHPAQAGLGEHHAAPDDLAARPAQPPEAMMAFRAAAEALSLTPAQQATLDAHLSRTMADLDMPHGTVVELVPPDSLPDDHPDTGYVLIDWTDRHGDKRRTSVDRAQFDVHFRAV